MAHEEKKFDTLLRNEFGAKFDDIITQIKEILLSAYDSELTVIDRRSKTNPQDSKYREVFIERLDEFEYLEEQNDKIVFRVPNMETFDFSGNSMRVVQQILEGTAGKLKEVSVADYELMFPKSKVISAEPLDTSVPKKELIYLMRDNNRLRVAERNAFGRINYLVPYPFSNTPPIPVLGSADQFVSDNMDRWVKKIVETTKKKFKQTT